MHLLGSKSCNTIGISGVLPSVRTSAAKELYEQTHKKDPKDGRNEYYKLPPIERESGRLPCITKVTDCT